MTLVPPLNLFNVRNVLLIVAVMVGVIALGHVFAPQLQLSTKGD